MRPPRRPSRLGPQLTLDDVTAGFIATVRDQGLIAVNGDDAAKFLHTQLTNDVEHLSATDVRFAGFCTPKGRLQASFLMWRDNDAVYLQLPRAIQAPLQKRLSMFVMRSKAKLVDATDAAPFATVLGLGGARAQAALGQIVPTLPATPMTKTDGAFGTVMRLNDAVRRAALPVADVRRDGRCGAVGAGHAARRRRRPGLATGDDPCGRCRRSAPPRRNSSSRR